MTMNEYNDPNAFDGIVHHNFQANPQVPPAQPYTDPHPYGPPAPHHGAPVKTGLTKRGKAVLTIAAVALAGGGLITWQHHADTAAANELKAKELQIQQDKLALEQQKALDKTNKDTAKAQTAADQARQAKVDACVNQNRGLVGKQLGYRIGDVIDDCQKQYPDTANSADMQEAASAQSTGSSGSGGTEGLLVGAGFLLVGGMWIGLRKATRPQPAAQPGPAPYPYPYYPHS
jgi:hypothetical protein